MSYTIETESFGMMPNQAEGTFNGKAFYFRARHGGWTIRLADTKELLFLNLGDDNPAHVIASGEDPGAGWWEADEARRFLDAQLRELEHAHA